ncbi:MAG: asparaginase [Betaproteobacteria bacterium]
MSARGGVADRLPRVVVVGTGGTIASQGSTPAQTVGYGRASLGADALIASVPAITTVADVRGEQLFQMLSGHLTSANWIALARRVNDLAALDDVDGIVVTHGTDALEETAYWLTLTARTRKPVVLTGAMRPASALSADGPMNLYNAIALAASRSAVGMGVLVAMNDAIHAARDAMKMRTASPDAFGSPEFGALGRMQDGVAQFHRRPLRRHTADSPFDVGRLDALPRVDVVYGHVGATRVPIDALVAAGTRGIVNAGFGQGDMTPDVLEGLQAARRQGVQVVRASRVPAGTVVADGALKDDALDFVAADTLNPQKARVLLMLALTVTGDRREIQRIFHEY